MKLIDKHLLRAYLVPVFYCLAGFSMMYVILGLFDKAADFLDSDVSLYEVIRYYAYFVIAFTDSRNVSFLVTVMPISLLAGALYSLSSLTRHNELTAMRASGVNMFRLMYPFFGVGIACSLLAMAIQETVAPVASRRVDEFEAKLRGDGGGPSAAVGNFKYYNRAAHRRWDIDSFDPAEPTRLTGVHVRIEQSTSTVRVADIKADSAEWKDHQWWLSGMTLQRYDDADQPVGQGWRRDAVAGQAVKVPLLLETPDDFLMAVDSGDRQGRYSSTMRILGYLLDHPAPGDTAWAKELVETHSRLAMPWACLIVMLLGIPAGTKGGRQGVLIGVLFAIALFILFYVAMQVGGFLGQRQVLQPWLSAWLPNLVFFVLGIVMLCRVRS